MLTSVQLQILKRIPPSLPKGRSKLGSLLGNEFLGSIEGKVVIDFGCGDGVDAVEMALHGARRVIGIDIREDILDAARCRARDAGVESVCCFTLKTSEPADVVISVDAFEHYADPGEILSVMGSLLRPDGEIFVSFGPTWYHPLGGHLFSVFPWAHLIFSEKALLAWRSSFKNDGATRFTEVARGLNQMTIGRFERLVAGSPFRFESLELIPIRKLRFLHTRLTREFTTAIVRCRLVRR